jgi:hypothetical protein
MSRFLVRAFVVLILLGLTTPLMAGEVVRFAEGRYMAVRSHEVEGDRISLDLGEATLVVPSFRVAEIRRDRRVVYGTPLRREELRVDSAPPREESRIARGETPPALR